MKIVGPSKSFFFYARESIFFAKNLIVHYRLHFSLKSLEAILGDTEKAPPPNFGND